MTQKQEKHQVSLKRPDGWYSADNEMVTVFAPLIGPYAFSVYHLLKQRSFLKEKERGISLVEIGKAVGMSKEAARAAIATLREFGLLEMQSSKAANRAPHYDVVHAKDVLGSQATSRLQENPHYPHLQAISRTLAKPNRERDIADVAGEISPVRRRDIGRQKARCRLPNKEEVIKDKVQEQDSTPLPPEGGGYSLREEQEIETQNETAVADGVVWVGAKVAADGPGAVELGGTRAGRIASTSIVGRVETTNPPAQAPASPGARVAADGLTPVRDTLAGMLRDLRADDSSQLTHREQVTHFLHFLHDAFGTVPTAPGYAAARGANWEDPYEAWQRCFDHVGYGGVEMDGERLVVVLETPRPKDLAMGLAKYQAKVKLAMKKAFGREVQLVPRLEAA